MAIDPHLSVAICHFGAPKERAARRRVVDAAVRSSNSGDLTGANSPRTYSGEIRFS
jgi:hypothetical protein